MALPPNVSEEEFASALSEFAQAVGDEWVFSSDEMLRRTATPTRFIGVSPKSGSPPRRLRRPMPKKIVRVANR